MESEDDGEPIITVCQGPPRCDLEGVAAMQAIENGCVWCMRITVHEDGTETIDKPREA